MIIMVATGPASAGGPVPSVGLYWVDNVDPTIAPGLSAPLNQLLIRTDSPAIYYKSGAASTAWTQIGASGTNVSGTTNKIAKFTSASTVGNSQITDDGTTVTTPNVNGMYLNIDQGPAIANFFWNNETTYAPQVGAVGNFGLGLHALHSLTTGINNLAIGWDSQFVNLIGNDNVSLGEDALKYVTANNNTGIGYRAGYSVSSGSQNTVMGVQALQVIDTGSYNTAIGFNAATQLTTNSSTNVALGYQALHASAAVNNNTALGSSAGFATAGNNGIFIGQAAGVNEVAGNTLYIDSLGGSSSQAIIYGTMNATTASQTLALNAQVSGLGARGWGLSSSSASATVPTLIPDRTALTTGIGANAAGQIDLVIAGANEVRLDAFANLIGMSNSGSWELVAGTITGTQPAFVPNKGSTSTGIGATAAGNVNIINGGVTLERFVNTGPAAGAGSVATGSRDRAGTITGVGATSTTLTLGTTNYTRAWCTANFNNHSVAPEIIEVTQSLTAPVFSCYNSTTGAAANCNDFTYHCALQ